MVARLIREVKMKPLHFNESFVTCGAYRGAASRGNLDRLRTSKQGPAIFIREGFGGKKDNSGCPFVGKQSFSACGF